MKRKKIKPELKEKLITEAGNKCANPGCSNIRTHIHHIDEWSIYGSNSPDILIPVCPTCHDLIHHGKIPISKEELSTWKNITRNNVYNRAHLYVEPSNTIRIQIGPFEIFSEEDELIILDFDKAVLSFSIKDSEILLSNATIIDTQSNHLIKVVQNYVKVTKDQNIQLISHPGRIIIETTYPRKFLPRPIIQDYDSRKIRVPWIVELIDIHVVKPGEITLSGIWGTDDRAVVISRDFIQLYKNGNPPHSLGAYGAGSAPIFKLNGSYPIINSFFK